MQKINATEWQWETANETYYNETTGGTLKPKAVLMIAPANGNFVRDAFRLVYKVNINAQKPYGAYDVFVDAATGQVIWQLDLIANTDAIGSAQTRYSGTQQITTDNTGSYNFELTPLTSYEIVVSREGYLNNKVSETTVGIEVNTDLIKDIKKIFRCLSF